MARTFTSNFITAAASKAARPYQVLQIDWSSGTKYYLDRPSDSFSATGPRVPSGNIGASLVVQWPSVSISLKEEQVGATDQCSVVLDDYGGEIASILDSAEQQRVLVTVWRMFDDVYVQWPTDAGKIFTGILRPFDWTAKDNQITLNLGDVGPLLAKDISCIAGSAVFGKVPQSYQDKNIPLCWGYTQRVEAILISAPWETKITQEFKGGNPLTVNIADHPDNMPGVTAETQYDATLGTDAVQVTFHQSTDPDNVESTATISVPSPPLVASAGANWYDDGSWSSGDPEPATFKLIFYYWQVQPAKRQSDLADVVQQGWTAAVGDADGGSYSSVVQSIALIPAGTSAWLMNVYEVTVNNFLVGHDNQNPPNPIYLFDLRNIINAVAFFPPATDVNPWPTGTVLRSKDTTHIYAANALPSRAVQRVEGYGTIDDASGDGRKDFVILGQVANVTVNNSTTTITYTDEFSVNRNDSTWAGALGRNITTLTFAKAPRDTRNNLDDNRIWITLQGVDDAGDGTGNIIANPATVILQYLENAHLMNVDVGSIDAASFDVAATALSGYSVGFAQIETRPGLELLQEIAAQCNSILLFDQGEAKLVVLSDTAGTIQHTFDASANDNMVQGSLSTGETSVDDLVNELVVKWAPKWDDKTGKIPMDVRAYKTAAIAAFGRISKQKDIYLYWKRTDVETQRDWWLNHLSTIWRTVKFTGFLDALILQPGDWIDVTWTSPGRDIFGGAKAMQVTKCTDTGKDGLVEIEARYPQVTYAS